jgi:hypothetical protein
MGCYQLSLVNADWLAYPSLKRKIWPKYRSIASSAIFDHCCCFALALCLLQTNAPPLSCCAQHRYRLLDYAGQDVRCAVD